MKEQIPIYGLVKKQTNLKKQKITDSKSASEFIRSFYSDDIEIFESFFVLMINSNSETIGYAKISQGGVVGTIVDIRLICKYAIDSLCVAAIIAHNHPSGNLKPSKEDIKLTKQIKKALDIFDIRLFDHVILTKKSYFSLADNELI